MSDADAALTLTPEEKFLYNTHLRNLNGTGKVIQPPSDDNPKGAISTLEQMSFERDGKTYNIPTVWGGKELKPDDAIKAAEKVGLSKFPAYDSGEEAEARYSKMHDFLEQDTADFIASGQKK